jgi:histidine triad (HIT) family protein
MSSIFTKIIQGEIPCYKIYEDELCFSFLSIEPHNLWHTLIVPKEEIGNILDLSDALMTHIFLVWKNILWPAIQRATGCPRVSFLTEWFGVPDHFHLHLIPLFQAGDLDASHAHRETPEAMQMIANKIQKEIL